MSVDHSPPTEEDLVSLVIDPAHRAQFRTRLSIRQTRRKLLDCLNHTAPIDARFTTWFEDVESALGSVNVAATSPCLLLSADHKLDGRVMPFAEAVNAMMESGWGTIIGLSASLAIYGDERGSNRYAVIKRKPS